MTQFGGELPAHLDLPRRKERSFEFVCPRCHDVFLWAADDIPQAGMRLVCPGCELDFRTEIRPHRSSLSPSKCWVCGHSELYVQKDLNPAPWWALVLASLGLCTLVALFLDPFLGAGAMAVVGLSEYLVYRGFSECLVCAVCGSVYRGFSIPPGANRRPEGLAPKFHELRSLWLEGILAREQPRERAEPAAT